MPTEHELIAAAKMMRPELSDLLGAEAPEVESKLSELLDDAKAGHIVGESLVAIVRSRSATSDWFEGHFKSVSVSAVKGWVDSEDYERPGGLPPPFKGIRYKCPKGDQFWYALFIGETPPACTNHHLQMVPG